MSRSQEHFDAWIATRRSLLSRLRDWGDERSWEEFVHAYGRLLHAVALKAGLSDAEAQDVVQETFLSVARKIPEFHYDPERGSFKAWLLKLTSWRITDQFRRRQAVRRHEVDCQDKTGLLESLPDPRVEAELSRIWGAEWEKNRLSVALERVRRQVSPRQFQIYQLHVLQECSPEKVGKALGVNRAQVYLAKHRVGARLKRELGQVTEELERPARAGCP